jgi:hypothetical protein
MSVLRYDTASTTRRVSSGSMVLRVRRQPWEFAHGVTFLYFCEVAAFATLPQGGFNV